MNLFNKKDVVKPGNNNLINCEQVLLFLFFQIFLYVNIPPLPRIIRIKLQSVTNLIKLEFPGPHLSVHSLSTSTAFTTKE